MAAVDPPKVRVGVGVFVLKSSRESHTNPHFLIGKRKGAHGAGTYALPGGHLEFGETPEECATRELMEETGLKVKNVRFLTATNDPMPADNKHYITMFTVCVRDDDGDIPEVREPEKCEGWEWTSWEEMEASAKKGGEDKDGRKLFLPCVNLVKQRPGVLLISL